MWVDDRIVRVGTLILFDKKVSSAATLKLTVGGCKGSRIVTLSISCKRGRSGRVETTVTITRCCNIRRLFLSLDGVFRCDGYSLLRRSARRVPRRDCTRRVSGAGNSGPMDACMPFQGKLFLSSTTDVTLDGRYKIVCCKTRTSSSTNFTCPSYSPMFGRSVGRTV